MSVQKALAVVLNAMVQKIGVGGIIDLSTGTGMSHMGLLSVLEKAEKNGFNPDEKAKSLLASVLAQWMCNIGRSDHQIQGYINVLGGGDTPTQNKIHQPERFDADEIVQTIKASIPV